jgi:hypothetical protein
VADHCTVCDHPKRMAIDLELTGTATVRDIAAHYGLKSSSVQRHKQNHIKPRMKAALERRANKEDDSLIASVLAVVAETQAILEGASDPDLKLRAIDRVFKGLELRGKVTGELMPTGPTLTINLIELGVKDEQEGRRLIDLGRAVEEVSPAEALVAAGEVVRAHINAHPDDRERIRKELLL